MVNAKRKAVILHGKPEESRQDKIVDWYEKLKLELNGDPAYREITSAALRAASLELDPLDPDVLDRILRIGRQSYERKLGDGMEPRVIHYLPPAPSHDHKPLVYYMRLGELIKVGTTINIRNRYANIRAEGILALEFGDVTLERQRHMQLATCHHHGEWFRMEPILAERIVAARADFETSAGMTVEKWLEGRLSVPRQRKAAP